MATNKKVKETVYTQYHNIVLWQNAEDYGALLKGDYVQVVGELQTRSYEKDNVKKYITEVIAHTLTLGVKKNKGTQSNFENFNDESIPF